MIKYIGSKRTLIPHLKAAFADLAQGAPVLDLFTGTTRVAQGLKQLGLAVHANDHNRYAWMNARCYIQADGDKIEQECRAMLEALQDTPPDAGWFTDRYCHEARFFHPDNGARIEGVRKRIAEMSLSPVLEAVALVSLMEAADRVDSTTGVQMAFLKQWAPRAMKPLALRLPVLLSGPGVATCQDALDCARSFQGAAAYLDPPYNQHNYRANYHVWETLIRFDEPEVYGVVRKRADCRLEKSDFNSKRRISDALTAVIDALDVPRLVLSFSDEGFLSREQLEQMLSKRGHVATVAMEHKRYVGAQIGIYSPKGRPVGKVSHLRNQELIFIVDPDADRARQAADRIKEADAERVSR